MKNLISKEEKERIDSICDRYGVKNYTINSDGTIDVDGDVDLTFESLHSLPLRFNKVSRNFTCSYNLLTTLAGSPKLVNGNFSCVDNKLTTLEHIPAVINGKFNAMDNIFISSYSGNIEPEITKDCLIVFEDELPDVFQDSMKHFKLILKYQRHFYIWNDDLILNEENFQELLDEINDGLE